MDSGQGSIQMLYHPNLVWNGSILVTDLALVNEALLAHMFTGHVQIHTSGRVRFIIYCNIVPETKQTTAPNDYIQTLKRRNMSSVQSPGSRFFHDYSQMLQTLIYNNSFLCNASFSGIAKSLLYSCPYFCLLHP